jgi:hypothetical protein
MYAIVDTADYEKLDKHKWNAGRCGERFYANRRIGGKILLMHRVIMDCPKGMVVDHKDHNTMNNSRGNLRVCTPSQNSQNQLPHKTGSSKFKGVNWYGPRGKWRAYAWVGGKYAHLGYFTDETEAAHAYDKKAIELHKEFAVLNFPKELYEHC